MAAGYGPVGLDGFQLLPYIVIGTIWDFGGISHAIPYQTHIVVWVHTGGIPSQLKDMGWDLPLGYALSLIG